MQDRCIATPGLIAEIIDNRFVCHLPYYRQAEIFAREGVRFDRKTLCDWAALGAHWLAIIYREIQREHWLTELSPKNLGRVYQLVLGDAKRR